MGRKFFEGERVKYPDNTTTPKSEKRLLKLKHVMVRSPNPLPLLHSDADLAPFPSLGDGVFARPDNTTFL